MTRFAVLDQSAATAGKPHQATIRETIAFARQCETLGYHRYWLAEHHNSPANVGTAPEILCAAIAAQTDTIRVGSAGVLLSHYAPLKVAEQFRVLSAVAPGRIDLGVGRSPGGNAATQQALNRGAPAQAYVALVDELLHWLDDGRAAGADEIEAFPKPDTLPEPWILGSSLNGATIAAERGLPFCFNYSHGTNYRLVDEALHAYRRLYRPSRRFPRPVASLSIWVLAAETGAEAERLFAPRAYWRVMLDRGLRVPMVSPDVARSAKFSADEQDRVDEMRRYSLVGAAKDVAGQLTSIVARHEIDEVVLATWTFDPADRFRSYALLADLLGMKARPQRSVEPAAQPRDRRAAKE